MKCQAVQRQAVDFDCRSPCGERGLKWVFMVIMGDDVESLPVRGAWVEMFAFCRPLPS